MTVVRLPGLIDVHVHMREPGATHKETWETGTAAALAGGITTVLAMPNTDPPVVDGPSLQVALDTAAAGARCDYAHYVGAASGNAAQAAGMAPVVAGLKMYLNQTYGTLRLDDMADWAKHLAAFPTDRPVVAHAEGTTAEALVTAAHLAGRSIHLCHISRREEIEMIKTAKEAGWAVTCEVAPHHLFLDQDNSAHLGPSFSSVRPPLGPPDDRKALWEHLEVIDCFASDHAPHLASEKRSEIAPPGFPGLETMLPLLLTAVHDGLLGVDDIIERMATRPREIFALPAPPNTWVEVDPDHQWIIDGTAGFSRAGWTPYAGQPVHGRVSLVVLRGVVAYDGEVRAMPGTGRDLRREES